MEMFLMGAVLALLGFVVSAALFVAAARDGRDAETRVPRAAAPAGFFVAPSSEAARPVPDAAAEALARQQTEALLLRIERHVRLEQAAAESFLHSPTPQSLHGRTSSPLMH